LAGGDDPVGEWVAQRLDLGSIAGGGVVEQNNDH
jgi:hypothetical protein